jgi:hypothetical protein
MSTKVPSISPPDINHSDYMTSRISTVYFNNPQIYQSWPFFTAQSVNYPLRERKAASFALYHHAQPYLRGPTITEGTKRDLYVQVTPRWRLQLVHRRNLKASGDGCIRQGLVCPDLKLILKLWTIRTSCSQTFSVHGENERHVCCLRYTLKNSFVVPSFVLETIRAENIQ